MDAVFLTCTYINLHQGKETTFRKSPTPQKEPVFEANSINAKFFHDLNSLLPKERQGKTSEKQLWYDLIAVAHYMNMDSLVGQTCMVSKRSLLTLK